MGLDSLDHILVEDSSTIHRSHRSQSIGCPSGCGCIVIDITIDALQQARRTERLEALVPLYSGLAVEFVTGVAQGANGEVDASE